MSLFDRNVGDAPMVRYRKARPIISGGK